jgi:hypothetical protein
MHLAGDKNVSYTAGAALLGSAVNTKRNGGLRVTVAVSAAAVAYLRHNSVNLALNEGQPLAADTLYSFEGNFLGGEAIELRFDTSCTVRVYAMDHPGEE